MSLQRELKRDCILHAKTWYNLATMQDQQETLPTKIKGFSESGITWGAIGALMGAITVLVPIFALKWIFVAAGVVLFIRLCMARFFEGRTLIKQAFGNLGLGFVLAIILAASWHLIPRPKEPPSAEEIGKAIAKEISKQQEEDQKKQQLIAEQKPPESSPEPKKKPKPSTLTSKPESANPQTGPSEIPHPPVNHATLTITQKPDVSTRADAPYMTDVIVQTTAEFPTLKIVLQCNKPLIDGNATVGSGGVLMMTSVGVVKDHPNLVFFTYQSAAPPFGPANPITFRLWSKETIKCDEAATF